MKTSLRFISLFATVFAAGSLLAQQTERFAYAVTDVQQKGQGWTVLRKLNTQTGQYGDVLLNGGYDSKMPVFDAVTKKQIENLSSLTDTRTGLNTAPAFVTGVAAIAYDKKNSRIWFTPMFVDQLRYYDLKSNKLYYVTGESLSASGNLHNDEAKIITRMVVAPDGNGYAISNDGMNFIRFSTGKKLKITSLGSLVDDPANNGISVHNRCSSFGGDMVADDDGNLYILSARNHVFKVDIETKVTTHLGAITGLPQGFTVNGAVVNEEGRLLVSSAVYGNAWFTLDPKTWVATEYKAAAGVFHSSDLANSNVLSTARKNNNEIAAVSRTIAPDNGKVAVYPNPVNNNSFAIRFNNMEAGNYLIELTDALGRQVQQRRISLNGEGQTETLVLNPNTAKGIYLVKVTDKESKSVFSQKIVVQ